MVGGDPTAPRPRTPVGAGEHGNHALHCWTAHQSHGQVTILFYVPRWTKKEDLQVVFGSDYIVAGIREEKEMVVQARLAGRINTLTSTWQLEKFSNKRSRSRSRAKSSSATTASRKRTTAVAAAGTTTDQNSSGSNHSSGESSAGGRGPREKGAGTERRGAGTTDRTASPGSSSETSSFDLLGRSTDTLESAGEWDARWSHAGESTAASPGHSVANSSVPRSGSPSASSPRRLDQSITLSEESGYIPSGSNSGGEGVRSLESSFHASQGSPSSRMRSDDDVVTDAKLVTLHLDKVDGGIWPFMVSGPASLSLLGAGGQTSIPFVVPGRHQSLDTALSEALAVAAQDGDEEQTQALASSFAQSTTTVDTIASDDSMTVLGVRAEEEQYDMDATSLALMGMRHAKQSHRSPFASTSTQEESQAFEYFKRAWRRAEIPLATKRLVEDYLPASLQQVASSSPVIDPVRSRLMARLGGPTALARLYVSYARLYLPSSQNKQSPLAFPLGGLTNPFGGGGQQDHLSSPNTRTLSLAGQEAMQYLREARSLDKNVAITETEWQEAQSLDVLAGMEREEQEAGARTVAAAGRAGQGGRLPSKRNKRGEKKRTREARSSKAQRDEGLSEKCSSDQGIVFVLVSRAALISVMVAGGVAVAGWWRRAAAAGGGG